MAAITKSNITNALKILYKDQRLEETVFDLKSRPVFTMIKKDPTFEGDSKPVPIMYEDVAGGSNDFATSLSNTGAMKLAKFDIDVISKGYYRTVKIATNALRRNSSKAGSFLDKFKIKFDSSLNALANDLEKSLFRSSDGHWGEIDASTTLSGLTMIFANPGEAKLWSVGDKVVAAADADSALRSSTALTVASTDYKNNQATFTGAASFNAVSWAAGDYLFREGDYVNAGDRNHISGFADWIPTTVAASGDDFFGQDRYPQKERLAGQHVAGSLQNIEDSIVNGLVRIADYTGGTPDKFITTYQIWRLLAKELGITVRRDPQDGKAGQRNFTVAGPNGDDVEIVPATFCPPNTGYLLSMKTWCLESMGPAVGIYQDDGSMAQRVSNEDALETRCVSYPQLSCNRPGDNAIVDFT